MPYYDDQPTIGQSFGSGFSGGVGRGLEMAFLRKQQEDDEIKRLKEQLRIEKQRAEGEGFRVVPPSTTQTAGISGITERQPQQDFAEDSRFMTIGDQRYVKEPTSLEQAQLKTEQQKGKETPVFIWDQKNNTFQRIELPEEFTGKGAKIVQPKSDLPERKYADQQLEIEETNKRKTEMIKKSAQDMIATIAKVKEGSGRFGLFGALPAAGGTERRTWIANVDKLLSGKIVNLMAEMKNASRTGATGFGQLNRSELQLLKDASTALKRTLSEEEALEILNEMEANFRKIIQGDEQEQQVQPEQQGQRQGGQLMEDAQGNKAMVYPDGSFEEVQ